MTMLSAEHVIDNTKRFAGRAENYRTYLPDYPPAVIDVLRQKCGLHKDSVIADIGPGTGIFAKKVLPHAGVMYDIEPKPEIHKTAKEYLASCDNFRTKTTKLYVGVICIVESCVQ